MTAVPQPSEARALAAVVGLGTTFAMATSSAAPWIVGILIDRDRLSLQQASAVITAEMTAMGLTTLLLAPLLPRLPLRPVFVAAVIVGILAQLASCFAVGFAPLLAVRIVSGIVTGTVYCIVNGQGARSPIPERTYAIAQTIGLLFGTMLNPMMGFGGAHFDRAGTFGGLTLYLLITGLPLLLLRRHVVQPSIVTGTAIAARAPVSIDRRFAVAALVVMGVASAATGGVFNFTERLAIWSGIGGQTLGNGLAVVSVLGIIGSQTATMLGKRFEILSLVLGLTVLGAISLWLMLVGSPVTFWISYTAWIIVYTFAYPFIFGLAAAIDPAGRLPAAAGSLLILMGAVGTAIGAYIVEVHSRLAFGLVAFALCTAAGLLAGVTVGALRRSASPAPVATAT